MDKLWQYVIKHTTRGQCTCGKCIDSPLTAHPELKDKYQPQGHTADVMFFKVAIRDSPDRETFLGLVRAEQPHWLDGKEHNYLEMGGDMGDQGIALTTQALGSLVGAWKLITPNMLGDLIPDNLKMQMAGSGMITILYKSVEGGKNNGKN